MQGYGGASGRSIDVRTVDFCSGLRPWPETLKQPVSEMCVVCWRAPTRLRSLKSTSSVMRRADSASNVMDMDNHSDPCIETLWSTGPAVSTA